MINKKDRGKVLMIENTCLKGDDKYSVILSLEFIAWNIHSVFKGFHYIFKDKLDTLR